MLTEVQCTVKKISKVFNSVIIIIQFFIYLPGYSKKTNKQQARAKKETHKQHPKYK
jgi:cellobiose-specific phosphotransferase system component IIC